MSFPFMSLPFDVQYRVILYAVTFPHPVNIDRRLPAIPLRSRAAGTALALCSTCREMYQYRSYYYRYNEFRFWNTESVAQFRRDVGLMADEIRNVTLDLRCVRTNSFRATWSLDQDTPGAKDAGRGQSDEPTLWQQCEAFGDGTAIQVQLRPLRYLTAPYTTAAKRRELALIEGGLLHILSNMDWLSGKRCWVVSDRRGLVKALAPHNQPADDPALWKILDDIMGAIIPVINACLMDVSEHGAPTSSIQVRAVRDFIEEQFNGWPRRPQALRLPPTP